MILTTNFFETYQAGITGSEVVVADLEIVWAPGHLVPSRFIDQHKDFEVHLSYFAISMILKVNPGHFRHF